MAPPRHPKLGYFINAAKKRRANPGNKQAKKSKPVEENLSDNSTPVDSSVESEIEAPPFSPLTDHNVDEPRAEMDFDINAATDGDGAASSAGGEGNGARLPRSMGAAGGTSTSSGGGMRGIAPLPVGIRQTPMRTTRIYRKQYLLRVQNEGIETRFERQNVGGSLDNNNTSYGVIRYPLHDVPVHMLGFYLSKSEMAELALYTEARVKNVSVDVFNKTGVLTFETASSTTNIGNNNIGIYLLELSKDLNEKRMGKLPNQPVLIEEVFWGYPYFRTCGTQNTEFTPDNANDLGAQYVRRTLNNKFEYYSVQCSDANSPQPFIGKGMSVGPIPYFDIWPFVTNRINASMNEGLFTRYNYTPTNGLVFANQYIGQSDSDVRFNNSRMPLYGAAIHSSYNSVGLPGLYNTGGQSSTTEDTFPLITQKYPYINASPPHYSSIQIENAADHLKSRKPMPPLVIGIEPLTSEIQTQGRFEIVKCHVDLLIQCELEMEIVMGTDYTNPNTIRVVRPNYKNPHLAMYHKIQAGQPRRIYENNSIQLTNKETYDIDVAVPESDFRTTVTLPIPSNRSTHAMVTRSQKEADKTETKIYLDRMLAERPEELLDVIRRSEHRAAEHAKKTTNHANANPQQGHGSLQQGRKT